MTREGYIAWTCPECGRTMRGSEDHAPECGVTVASSDLVRENSMNSWQLAAAGKLAEKYPEAAWFASYFAENGDLDLYLQDLTSDRRWRITRAGTAIRVVKEAV